MKPGAIAIAGTALVAGAAAWTWGPATPATSASPASTTASSSATTEGRVYLSKTQLAQALAAGTLDRPVKSLLVVRSPLKYGDYQWDDKAVVAGPTWIRVDLRAQLISIFRAGHEIGTAVIVYGGDNKETPAGKLHILGKAQDHRSSLYDAEMPYTLRLTDDGVSIHASSVRWGAATHGCIGVPPAFARRLFDATKVGDEVVIVSRVISADRQRSS